MVYPANWVPCFEDVDWVEREVYSEWTGMFLRFVWGGYSAPGSSVEEEQKNDDDDQEEPIRTLPSRTHLPVHPPVHCPARSVSKERKTRKRERKEVPMS
jgi:hypothetical protein